MIAPSGESDRVTRDPDSSPRDPSGSNAVGGRASDPAPRIVVGLATFRRNEDLRRLLPTLLDQCAARADIATVVVVDNSPEGDARDVVRELPGVTYRHETRPGIASARNAAVDVANDLSADAIVFLDDDEIPADGWLDALIGAWLHFGCAGVAGPVRSIPDAELTPWLDACGLFQRQDRPTGAEIVDAATNNLILDLGFLRAHHLRFDENYGLTGGSDTKLSQEIRRCGGVLRWCAEAEVSERVPVARLSPGWVVKRTMRTSNAWTRVMLELSGDTPAKARTVLEYAARGGWRVARGSVAWSRGRARHDVATRVAGSMDMASGAGILLAVAGRRRVEYARPAAARST